MKTVRTTNETPPPSKAINPTLSVNSLDKISPLSIVEEGFLDLVSGRKGASKEYSSVFRSILRELGIVRGTAIVLLQSEQQKDSVYALYHSQEHERSKKALSKCTALNLCQYLAFILIKQEKRQMNT